MSIERIGSSYDLVKSVQAVIEQVADDIKDFDVQERMRGAAKHINTAGEYIWSAKQEQEKTDRVHEDEEVEDTKPLDDVDDYKPKEGN